MLSIEDISNCAQIACVLEATYPKPGNVNRFKEFQDTKFEHFLASAIGIGDATREATLRGFRIRKEGLKYRNLNLGKLILQAVRDSKKWHNGKNTNLGIAILLIPLSASYGLALGGKGTSQSNVRNELNKAIRNATTQDAIYFFRAVQLANPGGLGEVDTLDVMDDNSIREIIEEKLNLHNILTFSNQNSIQQELTGKMHITYDVGYPKIMEVYNKTGNLNLATLNGFMYILASVPDSLIAQKKGAKVANKISLMAKKIIEEGVSLAEIKKFDKKIRMKDNSLNPGTTADLTASSLMVCLLNGVRP
tara:strand:+ start:1292 stop:2209 length:918 start_codon:yes stop_codon:yes gene_type:complete